MKALIILALFMCLTDGTILTYSGNQAEYSKALEYLETKGEVFFRFPVKDRAALRDLALILSIDKVDGSNVYAYANKQEFEKFLQQDLDYEVVTHPGDLLKNPKMYNGRPGESYEWDRYPTYEAYVEMMYTFEADYPELCKIEEIGESVQGRKLLVAKISDSVNIRETEPRILLISTLHGDEVGPYVLLLHLIDSLLSGYTSDFRIKNLVDSIEIWIAPLCNPDGTYWSGNHTVQGAKRRNANNVDLNRNFPCPSGVSGGAIEKETQALIDILTMHSFVMSIDFHAGAEMAIYPWNCQPKHHVDLEWFTYICRQFADTIQANSVPGYFMDQDSGVSNGYRWYEQHNTFLDYTLYFQHCRDITIELSHQKVLIESQLLPHWNYTYRSVFNYMEQVLCGVRGVATDFMGGWLKTKVFVDLHDNYEDSSFIYSEGEKGDYYRPIYKGTYRITYSNKWYSPQTIRDIEVENGKATIINVEFYPSMIVNTDNKNYKNMISLYQINEVINISFNEHYNIDGVYIYDLEGKLIKALKSNIKSNNTFWNGDDEYNNPVSNGCYIIHIDLGDKTLAKRFVFSR